MKAVVYRGYGGPEALEYVDLPDPKLGQNSVLVATKAAALNPADAMLQSGLGDGIMDAWFPVVPGWDVAGVVQVVGAGVGEFAPGDEVMGYIRQETLHHGAFAELVSTPVETLVRKPKSASWAEAAALPLAGLTAMRALEHGLTLRAGETVLIHGAAGGVGTLAVQLAILCGARVIGTASQANQAFVRELGATPVVYGQGLADEVRPLAPTGVDAILDCAGRNALATSTLLGKPDVRICSIVATGPGITTIYARSDRSALARLARLLADGKLRVKIAATYPLHEAAAAQRALQAAHGPGRIIIAF